MSKPIRGNTKGLAPSELRQLGKLYERKVHPTELIPYDYAREIFEVGRELRRRIGVLISREGRVEEVVVGSKDILYLPDLGRYRFGRGRLRRLRLVFSDISNAEREAIIPGDIYTDLEKLRLDAVVSVKSFKNRLGVTYAHLIPAEGGSSIATVTEKVSDLGTLDLDFRGFIEELEDGISTVLSSRVLSGKTRAVLVGVYPRGTTSRSSMDELIELAKTAGVEIADTFVQRREADPRTLIGKGKLEELVLRCLRLEAEMIIFDTELKPTQWRSLTNATELKVIDRSMLILDIFAQRATSSDGRLQVELAQLKYNLPRLVEMDSGLSRLSGGIGGRGPGETKLEISRRRIRDRISQLEKQIEKLGMQRELRRSRRKEIGAPLVAILGYTNVGKSTLFNAITKSDVITEDKLFATLDPAQRRVVHLQQRGEGDVVSCEMVFSDTVGFIRELPEELVNAFRSTLEELHEASLLVHVLDAADPDSENHRLAVEQVLTEMGLEHKPRITVVNKIDKLPIEERRAVATRFSAIAVSAAERENLGAILDRVVSILFPVALEEQRSNAAKELAS